VCYYVACRSLHKSLDLADTVIAAVECLKSWERAGLAQVDEVREVAELLEALEKRQAPI
jgi:hypothetical protein